MHELLAAMDPARRWQGRAVGAAVAGALIFGTWTLVPDREVVGPCDRAVLDAELAAVWNPERREEVATSLRASDRPYAGETADLLDARVESFAAAWLSTRENTCALSPTATDGTPQLDGRTACLQHSLAHLDRLLANIAAGRIEVEKATDAAVKLPWPDTCESVVAAPEPDDDVARGLRARLLEAEAMRGGKDATAMELAARIAKEAEGDAYAQIRGDALELAGIAAANQRDAARAVEFLSAARDIAYAQGDSLRWFDRARRLATAESARFDYQRARHWLRDAQAAANRRELGVIKASELEISACIVETESTHLLEAEQHCRSAMKMLATEEGPAADECRSAAQLALGTVFRERGYLEESITLAEEQLEMAGRVRGSSHPVTAGLAMNLGLALDELHRSAEATPHLERAVAVFRDASSSWTPSALMNLGMNQLSLGNVDAADRTYAEALWLADPHSSVHARLRRNLAAVRMAQGRFEEALEIATDAGRDLEGKDREPWVPHGIKGHALWALGRHADAVSEQRQAIELAAAAHAAGVESSGWITLALRQRAMGTPADALHSLARAEEVLRRAGSEVDAQVPRALMAVPLVALGKVDDAVAHLDSVPTNPDDWKSELPAILDHGWALVHITRGEIVLARQRVRHALQTDSARDRKPSAMNDALFELAITLGLAAELPPPWNQRSAAPSRITSPAP